MSHGPLGLEEPWGEPVPRAAPWAFESRPFGPKSLSTWNLLESEMAVSMAYVFEINEVQRPFTAFPPIAEHVLTRG